MIQDGNSLYDKYTVTEQFSDPRAEFWKDIAIAVAGSGNTKEKICIAAWADYALEEYDKRFGQIIEQKDKSK